MWIVITIFLKASRLLFKINNVHDSLYSLGNLSLIMKILHSKYYITWYSRIDCNNWLIIGNVRLLFVYYVE